MSSPLLYSRLVVPNDGSATNPSIQMGGSTAYSSQTGLYGTESTIGMSIAGVNVLTLTSTGLNGPTDTYSGSASFQPLGIDLTLAAGAGKDLSNTAFLAPIMGNLLNSATLTKTGNYLAGVIGAFSVTGALGTHMQAGGLIGMISDGVTAATGAVVAVLDGDSAITTANAAFAARGNNSTAGSKFTYGLDLYSPAHDGFSALVIDKDVRFANGTTMRATGDTIVFTNLAANKTVTLTMT